MLASTPITGCSASPTAPSAAAPCGPSSVDGSLEALQAIFDNLDVFTSGFAIVEP